MNSRRILLGILCLLGLFVVRYLEEILFYDPLKSFFNGAYQSAALPEMNLSQWVLSLLWRYSLNAVLSLGLLRVIFNKFSVVQFSVLLYVIVLMVLLFTLLLLAHYYTPGEYRALFYVRRFLIHPVLLLLLIPSFLLINPEKNP